MRGVIFSLAVSVYLLLSLSSPAVYAANSQPFSQWVADFKTRALNEGISPRIVEEAFQGVEYKSRIIELDRKQPEGRLTFQQYKDRVISQARINQGRKLYRQHTYLLQRISKKYGVPAKYIVALWGIETSYGNNTGGFGVIEALATLAYDGRRSEFFSDELINALKILDAGHISPADMKGSWAGAMGQNQFMPSSFHNFAVDGNNDGRRDIWKSLPDVFASTANYLSKSGWNKDERWGRAVKLPAGFDAALLGREIKKTLQEWNALGVRKAAGGYLPTDPDILGSVIAPDGVNGPAYLVYDNFGVIMRWNKSTYFATSVGLLADSIAAGG